MLGICNADDQDDNGHDNGFCNLFYNSDLCSLVTVDVGLKQMSIDTGMRYVTDCCHSALE